MTNTEMKSKFANLYGMMANSRKISNMKLFGIVMCEAMMNIIDNHPDLAEKFINRLCAIKWSNYLTCEEAERILSNMQPPSHWGYNEFDEVVTNLDGEIEKEPHYNKYALWVAMNMVYSDSASTIISIIGTNEPELIANAVYLLAKDKLCDEDGMFNIRQYFNV